MNRTTRIKTAQAPRMYNIDLTDQLDGETQTFTLEKPLNEQCTYYVIWNGTTYRNDPQNTWFSFNETWDELTTYFDHAPTPGAHRSLILVVSEAADGSDVGTEVYMDSEHQDFVQILTDENKVVSINGKAVSGLSPEELQAIYDAIDDVSNDVSAVSRDLLAETLARGNADASLQAQIDAITASSDVRDIVGTKAELDQYDTSILGDRDIIKVLQDETESNATTYYRWSAATQTFTLIGEEGPYYTKSAVDALLLDKADKATTYTKTEVDALISAIPQPAVFTGATSTDAGTSGLVPAPAAGDEDKVLKGNGTWGTVQGGLDPATTFWGQTAQNGVVSGNIILGNSSKGVFVESYNRKAGMSATASNVTLLTNISAGMTASYNFGYNQAYFPAPLYMSRNATGTMNQIKRLADPTDPQDAATKNYTDNLTISYAALNGSAAPTTTTEGQYIGQLYYDTTNEQLYFLKSIDDTTTPATYTWETVGGGGSGIPTDATFWGASYNATNNKVDGNIKLSNAKILGQQNNDTRQYIQYDSNSGLAVCGGQTISFSTWNTYWNSRRDYLFDFNGLNMKAVGIRNLADPTNAQDAATKNYVDTAVASAGATAYTNAEFNNLWENA